MSVVQELNGAPDVQDDGDDPVADSKNFAAMRRKVDKLEKENAVLRQRDMRSQASAAGFAPSKLLDIVVDRFMADNDEFDLEAFTAFAGEVGLPVQGSADTTTDTTANTASDPNSVESQIGALQGVGDVLRGASTAPEVKDLDGRIAEAEAKGDFNTSIALKSLKARGRTA